MERWYNVREAAEVMRCETDTARARMEKMPDVINAGTEKRRILMVPESNLEDWFRNHRMTQVMVIRPPARQRKDGKLARIDRRTGKLKAV